MGICLLVVSAPRDAALRNHRISRRFLAGAYVVLAAVGLWEVSDTTGSESRLLLMAFTLIAASFQALLFTFSLITLINIRYISARRIYGNVIPISVLSGVILMILFYVPQKFYPVFYTMLGFYCLQLSYYTALFFKEYKRYRRRHDNYFSGDEFRRSVWVRNSFVMALCVGMIAVGAPFADTRIYMVFIIAYTVFYVYFAIKTLNYATLFSLISPVVSPAEAVAGNGIRTAVLEEWIADRNYLARDITLEELAVTLNTNTAYLSRFINKQYGQNFRSWIGSLRIVESMRLMDENPDIPLAEAAEKAGIHNLSTFYRQFSSVTGLTPADYRKRSRGKSMPE